MHILVTGGMGFIGTNLVHLLAREGHSLTVVDHWISDHLNLPAHAVLIPKHILDVVPGDMKGIDCVVHLAAMTGVAECEAEPDKAFTVNVQGTRHLIELAQRQRVTQFVFASSVGAVLGNQPGPLHELLVPRPQSVYGQSKMRAEATLMTGRYHKPRVCILRFTNVYGPYSNAKQNVIPKLIRLTSDERFTIYGDGKQTRDYVAVGDVCNAINLCINKGVMGLYHIGSGIGLSLLDLIAVVESVKKTTINYDFAPARAADVRHCVANISHANHVLGWQPNVPLRLGVENTYLQWVSSEVASMVN